jgi:glycosyltransferase involved in cell wall biosynthesis
MARLFHPYRGFRFIINYIRFLLRKGASVIRSIFIILPINKSVRTFVEKIVFEIRTLNRVKFILRNTLYKIRTLDQYPARPLKIPEYYSTIPINPNNKKLPLISLVTPSYNQANFIYRTIESVLSQRYPNLEYMIQDGGSIDGSVEIIKSFEKKLAFFESRKDNGQAHALNLAFQRTSGEIMAYLNADDIFMPGALWFVANYFDQHPDVDVIYSHRIIIDENDEEIGRWILPPEDGNVILWADYIPQETMFWRRTIWEKVTSKIDESFSFALDWDLILKFLMARAKIVRVPRFLAAFRVHSAQKTSLHINELGLMEMKRLRRQLHSREVEHNEVMYRITPYFFRSFIYHVLYKFGFIQT